MRTRIRIFLGSTTATMATTAMAATAALLAAAAVTTGCSDMGVGDVRDDDGPGGGGSSSTDPLDPSLAPELDTDPSHYPANVWVTDAMAKVQPDATPGAVHWAILRATKNETESFQVHVRATDAPIELTVEISDLTDAVSGTTIPRDTIVVAREAYLDIAIVSDANGIAGRVPDALIPAVDPYLGERRDAFPHTIPPGETRSAWLDVLVPADAASGYYTGAVTVRDGDATLATLPVQLAVWDVALPSTATLRSAFALGWNSMCHQAYGSYEACGQYPGADGDADRGVELSHVAQATFFLDHRVSLAGAVYAMPRNDDWTRFDALYGPLLEGGAATRLDGARLTHLWFTGDQGDAGMLADWTAHFAERGWLDRTSAYFCDEPPYGCSFAETIGKADFIRGAAPALDTLLTTDLDEAIEHGLLDRVDVMVAIVSAMENRGMPDRRPEYDAWLADERKHLWWYQSCDEHESCADGSPGGPTATWPSYMVDASPMRNRVFQWMAYLYDVEGELYYATDYCWTQSCGGQGDPWVSQYAFGGNGDGTLFYPGTPAKIGGDTPVPVPSLRLALIRDGMEDYELLHALAAAGHADVAEAAARSFISSTYEFSDDPATLAAARRTLGDALHALAHP